LLMRTQFSTTSIWPMGGIFTTLKALL